MVSIHAPVWGATTGFSMVSPVISFNPRTRVGCDDTHMTRSHPYKVSIHAPVWGATTQKPNAATLMFGFNPRTRVGCDKKWQRLPTLRSQFQSTHPCGVRPATAWVMPRSMRFQSTHPCGVRPICSALLAS